VWFDQELRESHRRLRQSIPAYIREGDLLSLLTAPVTYSLFLPLVVLDLWVTLYQRLCFPIYRIASVPRRRYFAIDRHRLAYVREIAARTEQYWCPIKHARVIPTPHSRYRSFFAYGDGHAYRTGLPSLRRALREQATRPPRCRRRMRHEGVTRKRLG
jgi:hypothetical protein